MGEIVSLSSDDIVHPSPHDLAELSLFADLKQAELDLLASWFVVDEHAAGASLTREGTPGYTFYVLRDGTATVAQENRTLRELGPGDSFGELAIIGMSDRTATVVATSPVVVWSMFGTRFRKLEELFPALAEKIRTAYVPLEADREE
jgi:CRP-like cAMP-binding protein